MITDSHEETKKKSAAEKFSLHISCPFEIKLDFKLPWRLTRNFPCKKAIEKLSFSSFTKKFKLHTCHDDKIYQFLYESLSAFIFIHTQYVCMDLTHICIEGKFEHIFIHIYMGLLISFTQQHIHKKIYVSNLRLSTGTRHS